MSWKQVLVCSNNKEFLNSIQDILGELRYSLRLVRGADEIKSLEASYQPAVVVIECLQNSERKVQEIALSLWKTKPNLRIALMYTTSFAVDALERINQNPNLIYLQTPYENEILLDWMLQVAPVETPKDKLKFQHLSSVRIVDLGAKENLEFDLYYYMPSNKKFILYRRKNTELPPETKSKLEGSRVRDLYVHKSELPQLHKYLASRLKRIAKDGGLPEGERRRILKQEAKEIFRTLLGSKKTGPTESRLALEACKQVALQFIQETTAKPDLYQKLMDLASTSHTNYSHSINVSIYTTLFAIVLEEPNLEAASVGGLLHDIGMALLNKPVDERDLNLLSDEEIQLVETHPETGVSILKQKKLTNDVEIQNLVLGHHENFDGSGYPAGLAGAQISSLARVCAIADEFDHLTSLRFGVKSYSPKEAIEKMILENGSPVRFDPEMLERIQAIFTAPPLTLVTEDHMQQLIKPKADAQPTSSSATESSVADDGKRRRRVKSGMKY